MGCLGNAKARVRFFSHLAALWWSGLVPVASSDFQGSAVRKTGICAVSNTF